MRTILSIDGGGIRGIIPATVLAYIEERVGPVSRHFDLIAGTSTGGIIALALNRSIANTTQPMYSARTLIDFYEKRGPEIFHISALHKFASGFGLMDEKYSKRTLERVLDEYFSDSTLGSAICRTMVTAYDLNAREPFFFKSWRPEHAAISMRGAARATAAAPTYFEPTLLMTAGVQRTLVDGGVFVNNPAMSAYVEARRLFPDESEFVVVAIGTGIATRPIAYRDAKNWGLMGWARPALDVVFDGVSDAVDYQLYYLIENDYYRFQTDLAMARHGLGDASAANLDALGLEAEKLIENNRTRLDELCGKLKQIA